MKSCVKVDEIRQNTIFFKFYIKFKACGAYEEVADLINCMYICIYYIFEIFVIGSRGQWGQWGAWGQCSQSCEGGLQSRSRFCLGGSCVGAGTMQRRCNTHQCKR